MPDSIHACSSSNRSWLKFQISIASKLDLLIAATMDEEFTRATGNIGAVTNTLDKSIDIHKQFYVELLDIHTDPMLDADSVREMTAGLKNKLRDESTSLFRPLLEQARRADIQLEHARLDSFDWQRLRSRSGKDKGNDTEMGKSNSKGGRKGMDKCNVVDATSSLDSKSDDDTDADDDEWPWFWSVLQMAALEHTLPETICLWFEHV